jgi:hypothetical protein
MPTVTIHTPEKLIVSENGTAQAEPKPASNQLDKFVIANASFAIWLIFLAIGGGITALYYSRIGYLPEIEWQSVLIYLFIGSVVGGTLGLLLTISIFIPGALWSEFIIFDPSFRDHFAYDDTGDEPCIRSVIQCLGVPYAGTLLLSHVMLLLPSAFYYWLSAVGVLLLTFLLMRMRFERIMYEDRKGNAPNGPKAGKGQAGKVVRELLKPQRKFRSRQTFKYACWFTLSVLLSQISMFVIYRLSGSMGISWNFIYLTLLCTAGVCISNHVVALRHHLYPRQGILAALVAAGVLLVAADSFSSLSVRLMNRYGIGFGTRFNLLLTDDGYKTLKRQGVRECGEPPQVCDVEILSKVGDQYFFRVNNEIYVTLPKTQVVSIKQLNNLRDLPKRPEQAADR